MSKYKEYDYLIEETHKEIIELVDHLFDLNTMRDFWQTSNQIELPSNDQKYIDMYVEGLGEYEGVRIAKPILGVED